MFNFVLQKTAGAILQTLTTELIDEFIGQENPSADQVMDCQEMQDKLVSWLNEKIDIPFVSEEMEEDLIEAALFGVKSMVLMRLD